MINNKNIVNKYFAYFYKKKKKKKKFTKQQNFR